MKTKIWGNMYWKFFHLFSLLYPNNPSRMDKKKGLEFIKNIYNIIPCQKCAGHFIENLKKINISDYLDTKDKYILFFINFHNIVNKSLGKKHLSFMQSINKINSFKKEGSIINHYNLIFDFIKSRKSTSIFFENVNYFFAKHKISVNIKKPIVKKPIVKKPIVKKPIVKKPIVKKPIAKKPIAKKPIAKKPIAKKPIAKKPISVKTKLLHKEIK